jgi:hypothetical protein
MREPLARIAPAVREGNVRSRINTDGRVLVGGLSSQNFDLFLQLQFFALHRAETDHVRARPFAFFINDLIQVPVPGIEFA